MQEQPDLPDMRPSWTNFWNQLGPRCPDPRSWDSDAAWHGLLKPKIQSFARSLSRAERFDLLLAAYEHYRLKLPAAEHSAVSILIAELIASGLKPNRSQSCQILRHAHHYCGHGPDLLPPLHFLESAYAGRPYDASSFAAARAYEETLRPLRNNAVEAARVRLRHIAWLDATRSLECWTAPLRRDYQTMDASEQGSWQLRLRHNWWHRQRAGAKTRFD